MADAEHAKYRPYPAYKPSGVEWLGDIPEGWGHAPLKYMALEEKSLFLDGDWIESKDLSDNGIRYITTGNVGEGAYKEQGGGYISEETFKKINASEVFEGDILVSRLNPPIGRACMVPDLFNRIVTSVDNVIFRPDTKFHRGFVVYMLSSREYFDHTSNMARGATMQRISRGLLGNIRIVFPHLSEQTKIAAFLDHETAKIDGLIAKQQRLIALLEEKRQAVISHAVTKGLDPTAPLRPSGIDWLGDIPAHWRVGKVGLVCSFISYGFTNPMPSTDIGPYMLTAADIEFGMVNYQSARRTSDFAFRTKLSPKSKPEKGDLLITKDGTLGRVALVRDDEEICISQSIALLRVNPEEIHPEYLEALLSAQAYQDKMIFDAGGTTIKHIYISILARMNLSIAPRREQEEICDFIDARSSYFDRLDNQAQSAITLLKERRTALISAAVTGKIDLRDWQPPEGVQSNSIQESDQRQEALA